MLFSTHESAPPAAAASAVFHDPVVDGPLRPVIDDRWAAGLERQTFVADPNVPLPSDVAAADPVQHDDVLLRQRPHRREDEGAGGLKEDGLAAGGALFGVALVLEADAGPAASRVDPRRHPRRHVTA